MNCAEIEDLILNQSGSALVEGHIRQCADCRAFQAASQELDLALAQTRKSPERLNWKVMAAITPKPTLLPELLDFVGWAAMLAVILGVARQLLAT